MTETIEASLAHRLFVGRDEVGQTAWDHAQQNPALQGSYILDRLAIE